MSGAFLSLRQVGKRFGGLQAVNDLSFDVARGEVVSIIGPNGAGKTTMMDIITGKTRPDSGTVFFGSTIDLLRHNEPQIAQLGIGRKFQTPTVYNDHTVIENLILSLEGSRGVFRSLFSRLNSTERDRIDGELQLALDAQTEPWGIKVHRYEVKNIVPPASVKDAMGKDEIEPIKTKAEALAQAAAGLMQYAQPGAAEGAPGAEGAAGGAAGRRNRNGGPFAAAPLRAGRFATQRRSGPCADR